jgi:NADH-quinone oxidoreductase subunit L
MTHAFFKGLLFLGAGAVIHGMHDEQDIKKMGGLKDHMPTTYKTFAIATLAISGIPFFSGFFSKDEILWKTFSTGGWFAWLLLASAAFFTAFYMFRLLRLTFFGKGRYDHHHIHPHEAPNTMTIPLIVLAILSAFGGFLGVPHILGAWFSHSPNLIDNWLEPIFKNANGIIATHSLTHSIHSVSLEYILMIVSVCVAVLAIYTANKFYKDVEWRTPRNLAKNFRSIYKLLWNKYYLDEIYFGSVVDGFVKSSRSFLWKVFDVKIIDGLVNGLASVTVRGGEYVRKIQTGVAPNYALMMVGGIVVIIAWMILAR